MFIGCLNVNGRVSSEYIHPHISKDNTESQEGEMLSN